MKVLYISNKSHLRDGVKRGNLSDKMHLFTLLAFEVPILETSIDFLYSDKWVVTKVLESGNILLYRVD